MDIEFHYYITGIIADYAGFTKNEVEIIAYSSQFVDNNDVSIEVGEKGDPSYLKNYISQTMNILKAQEKLKRIYPIFHFVPGNPLDPRANRTDGKMHHFNCTPNSPMANSFFDAACLVDDNTRLYRIGIATHTYVDTWAHQNFVGWGDNFNGFKLNPLPNYGHADAGHHPDFIANIWDDTRLTKSAVSNNHRFLGAAKALFNKYLAYHIKEETYTKSDAPAWEKLQNTLEKLFGPGWGGSDNKDRDQRIAAYKKQINKKWVDNYERGKWLEDAITKRVRGLDDSKNLFPNWGLFATANEMMAETHLFEDKYSWKKGVDWKKSDWYLFQKAIIAHEKFALDKLSPIFKSVMGIDLRQA
ncbi:MAG: hypothetical protein QNL04_04305 [SAR324 cluster bacterium]|nr:hypothetical protein [SAR324 cluster bacterium]